MLLPGEGKAVSAAGNDYISKAVGEDTGGALWVAECSIAPGFGGPPPHVHRSMQEMFYVLEGELVLRLDERTFELGPGGFGLVSPGDAAYVFEPGSRARQGVAHLLP